MIFGGGAFGRELGIDKAMSEALMMGPYKKRDQNLFSLCMHVSKHTARW